MTKVYALTPETREGFVYFAREKTTGLIKIGFAVTPHLRIKAHGFARGGPFELLALYRGAFPREREEHKRFASALVEGREWFRETPGLTAYMHRLGICKNKTKSNHERADWDTSPITDLQSILNVGREQIVWGGNYYDLPPTRGWLSWFKPDAPPSLGNFELAWTNLDRTSRQISQSIAATNAERVGHPTQKPLAVMLWCLGFVPDAETILDPFMGSGTVGVAAVKLGRKFIGVEIEPRYFEIACRRIEEATRQRDLFIAPAPSPSEAVQPSMFEVAP